MNTTAMNVEIFYTGFKSMPKNERRNFINILLSDKEFEDDPMDIATINQRIKEPSISSEDYLNKRKQYSLELQNLN